MNRSAAGRLSSVVIGLVFGLASMSQAAEWTKLLEHPPAGANTIALINAEELRFGAAKLKRFKEGEQQEDAAEIVADLPDNLKRAALSAYFDPNTLQSHWELVTGTFDKKIGTPRAIADQEGGYVDKISNHTVVWSPRRRYFVPLDADRMAVHIPANRSAVSQWLRGLGQPSQALPGYLKQTAERAIDRTALLVAFDMADSVSPTQAAENVQTLQSVVKAKLNPESLGKLLGDLKGLTFSVSAKERFFGELRVDFNVAPTLIREAGRDIVVEICGRHGILLPEMKEWDWNVDGKAFVMSGPLDAISIVNLLAVFRGSPSSSDSHSMSSEPPPAESSSNNTADMAKASKRYFGNVQKLLKESRNTKGLSPAERGVYSDKLSRKIDDLPMLNVDPDLLNYGANVAELIRGAGLAIRSANVAAGGQRATQANSSVSYGWGGGWSFNDNTAYNQSLMQQAHADGMQSHLSNMQQVDSMTAQIRRTMTERYKVEF
jgi:hypothetical protein